MSVTYLIEFAVLPAQRERFVSLLNGVLDAMRDEAMFVDATLHVDPEDDCQYLLHETWRDHKDVVDVQLQRPYREDWHAALPTLLRNPREVSMWVPLRADRAS